MREKILVVDDDDLLLRSVVMLLWKENYAVESASNGEDAMKLIEKETFDLIILDIRMPGLDGVGVLNKIRQMQKNDTGGYVIIMTGYASEDVPITALKLGAIDYIMKPFETTEFLNSIKRGIKMVELNKEKEKYLRELEEANRKLKEANIKLRQTGHN